MNAFTILKPYAGIWLAVLLFATLWSPAQVLISQRTTSLSCAALPYHQFDFWVGDWDAFDSGTPRAVARVRVERILDRCVLLENYEDTSGAKGKSFSIYDASTGRWHQSWVTNKGRLLLIDGNFEGNAMVLSGKDRTADGKDRLVRGTWKPLKDGVREIGVTSMDGGRTWQPWFDLVFRPHHP